MLHSKIPIRKVKGRKLYLVDCRYVGGKKEYRKTWDEAAGLRDSKLKDVREHGTSALSLSHADRVEFVAARERLSKLGLSVTQAVEFAKRITGGLNLFCCRKRSMRSLAEKEAGGNRERSVKNVRSNVSALIAVVGDKLVSEVSRSEVVCK